MCIPLASKSGRRSYKRVQGQRGGEYDVFIEHFPRRYRPGHPNYVGWTGRPLQPGQPIPCHVDPETGKAKNPKNGRWYEYQNVMGAQFRGGRFFAQDDMGQDLRPREPVGAGRDGIGAPGNAGMGERFGQNVQMNEARDDDD